MRDPATHSGSFRFTEEVPSPREAGSHTVSEFLTVGSSHPHTQNLRRGRSLWQNSRSARRTRGQVSADRGYHLCQSLGMAELAPTWLLSSRSNPVHTAQSLLATDFPTGDFAIDGKKRVAQIMLG